MTVAKKVVQDATNKEYKIDKVLMIGGSSRIKLLQELLSDVVGEDTVIETCGDRDIVVALGNVSEELRQNNDGHAGKPDNSLNKEEKKEDGPVVIIVNDGKMRFGW